MATANSANLHKTSYLVKDQVPDFVQADHPRFVQFLEQYYEYLQAANTGIYDSVSNTYFMGPTYFTKKALDYIDVDTTDFDKFLDQFKAELAPNLPKQLDNISNKPGFYKNILDFYRAKGTEDSFKLLFRLLYGEEIELYYPNRDILTLSGGTFFPEVRIRLGTTDNIEDVVGRRIYGANSGIYATVERIERVYDNIEYPWRDPTDRNDSITFAYLNKFSISNTTTTQTEFDIGEVIYTGNVGGNHVNTTIHASPTKTVFFDDFSTYSNANFMLAPSDNRGALSRSVTRLTGNLSAQTAFSTNTGNYGGRWFDWWNIDGANSVTYVSPGNNYINPGIAFIDDESASGGKVMVIGNEGNEHTINTTASTQITEDLVKLIHNDNITVDPNKTYRFTTRVKDPFNYFDSSALYGATPFFNSGYSALKSDGESFNTPNWPGVLPLLAPAAEQPGVYPATGDHTILSSHYPPGALTSNGTELGTGNASSENWTDEWRVFQSYATGSSTSFDYNGVGAHQEYSNTLARFEKTTIHSNVFSYIESPAAFHTDTAYMRPFIQVAHNHNWAPRAYSLFDAPINDYDIGHHSAAQEATAQTYPITYANNLMNVTIDASGGANSYFGDYALKAELPPSQDADTFNHYYITFANNKYVGAESSEERWKTFGFQIPKGKRWIYSYYVKANGTYSTAGAQISFSYVSGANSGPLSTGYADATEAVAITASDTWQRISGAVDFTTSDVGLSVGAGPKNEIEFVYFSLRPRANVTQGLTYWFDALQFEEAGPGVTTPSSFRMPGAGGSQIYLDYYKIEEMGTIEPLTGKPSYLNESSRLSTRSSVIQDNVYYQHYAYDIRSKQDFKEYTSVVEAAVHPAGFKRYGTKLTEAYRKMSDLIDVTPGTITQITTNALANDSRPNWSPDGTQIVFQSDRNDPSGNTEIFIMNSDGTNQTNITSGSLTNDVRPVWSPDGKKIAFRSSFSRDIPADPVAFWKMDSANSTGWIENAVNPGIYDAVWVPGSTGNVFVSDTIFGSGNSAYNPSSAPIGLLDSDELVNLPNANTTTFTLWFKPTGINDQAQSRIITRDASEYFALTYGENWSEGATTSDTVDIRVYHDAGFETGTITDGIRFGVWNFFAVTVDYTPGVHEVVGYSYNEIDGFVGSATQAMDGVTAVDGVAGKAVKIGGNSEHTSKLDEQIDWDVHGQFDHVRFYDKILTQTEIDNLFGEYSFIGQIFSIDIDGSGREQLTTNTSPGSASGLGPVIDISSSLPAWSPDGTQIAFSTFRDGNAAEIYIMNADGSDQTRITQNTSTADWEPAWSPDGKKIAFNSSRDEEVGSIETFVMDIDGTNITQLTSNTGTAADRAYQPDWSPDGTQIVFASRDELGQDSLYDISVMNADGSGRKVLTPNTSSDYDLSPAWSPDGTQIAFNSNRDGNSHIYIMDVRNRLADTNLSDTFSPDSINSLAGWFKADAIGPENLQFQTNAVGTHTVTNYVPSGFSTWSPDDVSGMASFGSSWGFGGNKIGHWGSASADTYARRTDSEYVISPGALEVYTGEHSSAYFYMGTEPASGNKPWSGQVFTKNPWASNIKFPPNKKWLVSVWSKISNTASPHTSSATNLFNIRIIKSDAINNLFHLTVREFGNSQSTHTENNQWKRESRVFDLTLYDEQQGQFFLQFYNPHTTYYLDGLMMEEYIPSEHGIYGNDEYDDEGNSYKPSDYVHPSMSGANVMSWYDSSENKLHAHANTSMVFGTQWAPPQYVSDTGTGHPAVRFRSNTVTHLGGGIINMIPQGYAAFNSTALDYDIRSATTSAGFETANLYPIALSDANNIDKSRGSANAAIIDTSTGSTNPGASGANSYFDSTSFKFLAVANPPHVSRQYFWFANNSPIHMEVMTANDYSITIPKGKRWIYSCYAKTNAVPEGTDNAHFVLTMAGANLSHGYAGYLMGDQGVSGGGSTWGDISLANSTYGTDLWQRVSYVFDLTADADLDSGEGSVEFESKVAKWDRIVLGGGCIANVVAGTDRAYWFDGFQLEEVGAGVTEPNEFLTPDDSRPVFRKTSLPSISNYATGLSGKTSPAANTLPKPIANQFTGFVVARTNLTMNNSNYATGGGWPHSGQVPFSIGSGPATTGVTSGAYDLRLGVSSGAASDETSNGYMHTRVANSTGYRTFVIGGWVGADLPLNTSTGFRIFGISENASKSAQYELQFNEADAALGSVVPRTGAGFEDEIQQDAYGWVHRNVKITPNTHYVSFANTTSTITIQAYHSASAPVSDFIGADYPYVTIRMRKGTGANTPIASGNTIWSGELQWSTVEANEISGVNGWEVEPPDAQKAWITSTGTEHDHIDGVSQRDTTFDPVTNEDEWVNLTWDLRSHPYWTNRTVQGIQFTFYSTIGSAHFPKTIAYDIDYIAIHDGSPDPLTFHYNGLRRGRDDQKWSITGQEDFAGISQYNLSLDRLDYDQQLAWDGTFDIGYTRYQEYNSGVDAGLWFDGDMAEIVWFNEQLSNTNIALVEGYLAHKYGIQDDLIHKDGSGDHPYKYQAPPAVGANSTPY